MVPGRRILASCIDSSVMFNFEFTGWKGLGRSSFLLFVFSYINFAAFLVANSLVMTFVLVFVHHVGHERLTNQSKLKFNILLSYLKTKKTFDQFISHNKETQHEQDFTIEFYLS